MDMNILTIFVIGLFLIVVYISKTNRSSHVRALYVVFGVAFVILMMIHLYKEQVFEKGNFTNFVVMSVILSGLVVLEGLEIFELLPDFTEKPKEA